jgi:hypothetical protein
MVPWWRSATLDAPAVSWTGEVRRCCDLRRCRPSHSRSSRGSWIRVPRGKTLASAGSRPRWTAGPRSQHAKVRVEGVAETGGHRSGTGGQSAHSRLCSCRSPRPLECRSCLRRPALMARSVERLPFLVAIVRGRRRSWRRSGQFGDRVAVVAGPAMALSRMVEGEGLVDRPGHGCLRQVSS